MVDVVGRERQEVDDQTITITWADERNVGVTVWVWLYYYRGNDIGYKIEISKFSSHAVSVMPSVSPW